MGREAVKELVANEKHNNRLVQLLSTSLLVREVWGSIPGSVKSDTASSTTRYHCDVCVVQTLGVEMGPATQYTFRRNSANI